MGFWLRIFSSRNNLEEPFFFLWSFKKILNKLCTPQRICSRVLRGPIDANNFLVLWNGKSVSLVCECVIQGFSSSCVFPCCCALSPAENRPVCQTHALYGNREMWASGERCSYFKRKSSLLLSERFFHPWYRHTGAFPLLWQKMWSRVVLYVYAFDIL